MDQRFVFVFELLAQNKLSVLARWVLGQKEVAHSQGASATLRSRLPSALASLLTRRRQRLGAGRFQHCTVVFGRLCHCNHLATDRLWSLLLLLAQGPIAICVRSQQRRLLLAIDLLLGVLADQQPARI